MKDNSQYRAEARQALAGNWGSAALLTLIYALIVGMVGAGVSFIIPGIGSIAARFLFLPITLAFILTFLFLLRGEKKPIEYLFQKYNKRTLTTMVLADIYTMLWALLLIIPGIIKSYSYAMVPYILKEDKTVENNAAIEKSMEMMQGYKMKLFLLDLSFLGWYILSIPTFGIAVFWVQPYHLTARAAFYEDLKNSNK